mgnify:FL=1
MMKQKSTTTLLWLALAALIGLLVLGAKKAPSGPVPIEIALAELIATGHLVLVAQWNEATQLYEAFVPGLPGNTLTTIRPSWLIHVTMSVTHTIASSGASYVIPANTPTMVITGDPVAITLVS